MNKLDIDDFAEIFHVPLESFAQQTVELIENSDFRFSFLEGQSLEETILFILQHLNSSLISAGQHRQADWEKGWAENLENFINSKYDPAALSPRYYPAEKRPLRFFGKYIMPENPGFLLGYFSVLRSFVAYQYLKNARVVCEFGCGPAHNLLSLSEIYPSKKFVGLDWAESSQRIIAALSEQFLANIEGHYFDMFSPDYEFFLPANSAVLTVGSLEQLGVNFEPFLHWLLSRKPSICVHIEPIYELYDRFTLSGYLAAEYSLKRGYLRGFYPRLKDLEREGRISICCVQQNVSSLLHDGWTLLVWKPAA